MNKAGLVDALAASLPRDLSEDLVNDFLILKEDVATGTLGRATPGKFVESVVQAFQHLENGSHEAKAAVDEYLRKLDSRKAAIPDGLRLAGARIARAMYTLRNKRSIAHKSEVDPNQMDLRFLLASAEWVLSELVRTISGLAADDAARLITQLHQPVPDLVDSADGRSLVLDAKNAEEELLILLHSQHPNPVTREWLNRSTDRLAKRTVRGAIAKLWDQREIHKLPDDKIQLTNPKGLSRARKIVADQLD